MGSEGFLSTFSLTTRAWASTSKKHSSQTTKTPVSNLCLDSRLIPEAKAAPRLSSAFSPQSTWTYKICENVNLAEVSSRKWQKNYVKSLPTILMAWKSWWAKDFREFGWLGRIREQKLHKCKYILTTWWIRNGELKREKKLLVDLRRQKIVR